MDTRLLRIEPIENQELLASMWLRWKKEGLLPVIFHEGIPPLNYFLQEWMSPERVTLGCFRDWADGRAAELHGICWISQTFKMLGKFSKAEIGMAFIRGSNPEEVVEWVRRAINYAFIVRELDAIFGCTPEPNRAAVLLGRRAGFKQTGVVEGYTTFNGQLCSAVFQHLTRQAWEALERTHGRQVEVRGIESADPENTAGPIATTV